MWEGGRGDKTTMAVAMSTDSHFKACGQRAELFT